MRPINLSFSACGFLGIYHLGAASAFHRHGRRLLKEVEAFAGASAGSLVASVLLTAPEKIEECHQFACKFAEEIRQQSLGAVTPGYDFMARLRSGMEAVLPANAHQLAQRRLHVSITNAHTRQNHLISRFSSREDLIQVLLASSFIPIYAGLKPVQLRGQWVDGGLTDSLPILPVGRTVTISPFSGRTDVSPQDRGQPHRHVNVCNQDVRLSLANLRTLVGIKPFKARPGCFCCPWHRRSRPEEQALGPTWARPGTNPCGSGRGSLGRVACPLGHLGGQARRMQVWRCGVCVGGGMQGPHVNAGAWAGETA
uniref:patatin-like phospholipase domain-containing protein 4 isoform X2 n=1 Tax=Jaculus jaculus TaxID=51337 RepID=UPI001E1B5767|nr:patatin-like phospholipase domain-containing protein 4 isoform X2 [Jaculus jaculus]